VLLLVLSACAATRTQSELARTPKVERVLLEGSALLPSPITPQCGNNAIVLTVHAAHIDCPANECSAAIPYWIENCSDRELALEGVATDHVGFELAKESQPKVMPHARTRLDYPPMPHEGLPAGTHMLRVKLVGADGPDVSLTSSVVVINDALERERARCIARGGLIGSHGECNIVSRDAGKPCHDERDCTGVCIFERQRRISAIEFRVFGHCSRLLEPHGCYAAIEQTDHGRVSRGTHYSSYCD
jgi:hypothetical protein